jgi:hypothetical protein
MPIWSIIKALPWRLIGPALAVAAALWFAFDTGRDNMRAKLQPRIQLLTRERDAARANVATLQAAIARQNAASAAAAAQTAARQDKAAKPPQRPAQRVAAAAGALQRIERDAAAVPAVVGCATPQSVRDWWEAK